MTNYYLNFIIALLLIGSACNTRTQERTFVNPGHQAAAQQPQAPNNQIIGTATSTSTNVNNPIPFNLGVLDQNSDFVGNGYNALPTLQSKFPVHEDNSQIAVLADGPDYLAARWQMLQNATRSVRLQALVFHGDEAGWFFAEKLIELKQRGIDVRVMVDSVSNVYKEDQSMYLLLMKNGIKVQGYDAYYTFALQELSKTDTIENIIDRVNQRYHEKMFIVDAEIPEKAMAIVGGANFASKYFRVDQTKQEENWRDKDVLLRGAIVQDIAKCFDENEKDILNFIANSSLATGNSIVKMITYLRDVLKMSPLTKVTVPDFSPALQQIIRTYAARKLTPNWQPAKMRFLRSRPQHKEYFIHYAYLDMIQRAQHEILIMGSYFIPTPDIRLAIKQAVRRGVSVKILTNDVRVSDYPFVMKAARTLYPDLLSVNAEQTGSTAKLELYEWAGDPQFGNKYGLHHAKFGVFDGNRVIVGSFNIDPRSRNLNSESVVAFESATAAGILRDEFMRDSGPTFALPISYDQALKFKDPDGFLKILETRFHEALQPIL